MSFEFLIWFFLIGIIIATLQDLKRREVDNWLNLFLMIGGIVFISYGAILDKSYNTIFHLGFILIIMFGIMNLFYYGRVFAGGDAKLLIAMTALFIGASFYESTTNIGVFLFFLMLSGSIYGLLYSGFLYSKNRKTVNKEMGRVAKKFTIWHLSLSLGLILLGFVNFLFLLAGIFSIIFMGLYIFAKGLENVSMIRKISGENLREGDWLVKDIKIGKKIIKANWDGLSLNDIKLLKKKKIILIKEGIAFVPAFLIAFLGYIFLKDWFIGILLG
ncbi:prepilin peptidase [archaeon]|nr:prepilin peptidase [archaeon]